MAKTVSVITPKAAAFGYLTKRRSPFFILRPFLCCMLQDKVPEAAAQHDHHDHRSEKPQWVLWVLLRDGNAYRQNANRGRPHKRVEGIGRVGGCGCSDGSTGMKRCIRTRRNHSRRDEKKQDDDRRADSQADECSPARELKGKCPHLLEGECSRNE